MKRQVHTVIEMADMQVTWPSEIRVIKKRFKNIFIFNFQVLLIIDFYPFLSF